MADLCIWEVWYNHDEDYLTTAKLEVAAPNIMQAVRQAEEEIETLLGTDHYFITSVALS